MIRALRVITVERGIDPRDLTIVAFGGAGGMHACRLAEELRVDRILFPRAGGVLSALGLAVSDLRRDYVAPLFGDPETLAAHELEAAFAALERRAQADLPAPVALRRFADARFRGQSFELTIPVAELSALTGSFRAAHRARYGYELPDAPVELVAVRVAGTSAVGKPKLARGRRPARAARRERSGARAYFDGELVRDRRSSPSTSLAPGDSFAGPAVVEFPEATCVVRPGWTATLDDRRRARAGAGMSRPYSADPVTLSVFVSALVGIAEEMGVVLIRSSRSSNIKERRDCSCALFDADGRMVAQAEHIPVHLGAMAEAVASVLEHHPEPGDVFALNDPYSGGTHLPGHHARHADRARRCDRRLRRRPRPPFGRRRHAARVDAQRLPVDLPGGDHHPAGPPRPGGRVRRRRARAGARERPHARDPAGGSAGSAGGEPRGRRAVRRADRPLRARVRARRLRRRPGLQRAPHAGCARRRCRTGPMSREPSSRATASRTATSRSAARRRSTATGSGSTSREPPRRWPAT